MDKQCKIIIGFLLRKSFGKAVSALNMDKQCKTMCGFLWRKCFLLHYSPDFLNMMKLFNVVVIVSMYNRRQHFPYFHVKFPIQLDFSYCS